MQTVWGWVLAVALAVAAYPHLVYPGLLFALSRLKPGRRRPPERGSWPVVTISVPAYNEEASIAATLNALLDLDYPRELVHVLVISDASTDRTDEIVRAYADRGVELLRMPTRGGKTAAENASRYRLRGEVLINTDASVRLDRSCVKPLVAALLAEPDVGVASGRDVSVSNMDARANVAESGYVGYEMWVRGLETRLGGIVGASGCLYAIRPALYMTLVPEALSRDFAAALIARENGYRSVSVDEAVCYVPRTPSLHAEYRRKVRTIARGMETLWYKRHLLNPLRHGLFSWMLLSHKVMRWLSPWAAALALISLVPMAAGSVSARVILAAAAVVLVLAAAGWFWPRHRSLPRLLALPAFIVAGNAAAMHATIKAMRRELNPVWEPTRRAADAQ
jgi:cellulose synthase/poly-beta-1,6-N-acetylglucosamine synthase-like glycosyltransferase